MSDIFRSFLMRRTRISRFYCLTCTLRVPFLASEIPKNNRKLGVKFGPILGQRWRITEDLINSLDFKNNTIATVSHYPTYLPVFRPSLILLLPLVPKSHHFLGLFGKNGKFGIFVSSDLKPITIFNFDPIFDFKGFLDTLESFFQLYRTNFFKKFSNPFYTDFKISGWPKKPVFLRYFGYFWLFAQKGQYIPGTH